MDFDELVPKCESGYVGRETRDNKCVSFGGRRA